MALHRRPQILAPECEPLASARAAGLHYVTDRQPGMTRQRRGADFSYYGVDGRRIRDTATLQRIRALGIPPAWTDVWICPDAEGHLQATGRDSKGRKQYRYHPHWRAVRDDTKYGRVLAFAQVLPSIRQHVEKDLVQSGLPRDKVVATVVRLLDTTHIRIGNTEYARTNQSYGLTTLRDRHVAIDGATLRFQFRGKSGKEHTIAVSNRRLATIVRQCRDLPGHELFRYVDQHGQIQTITSSDINAYLRRVTRQEFTAKDFRTWAGTLFAARALLTFGPGMTRRQTKQRTVQAISQVAEHLGNTVAVCRKCYVHPAILLGYSDGSLFAVTARQDKLRVRKSTPTWNEEEATLVAFLRQWLARSQGQNRAAA